MKIEILNHEELNDKHLIEIRVEQEENSYENSIAYDAEIDNDTAKDLSKDELYTLAYNMAFPTAIRVFKDTGYVEEEDNPIDFNIIKPSAAKVVIIGNSVIRKVDGVDPGATYFGNVHDQYGNYMKNCDVELLEPIEGVSIDDGLLILGDYTGEVKLHCSYYSHEDNVVVTVENEEKRLSDDEIILNAIADLYERLGAK